MIIAEQPAMTAGLRRPVRSTLARPVKLMKFVAAFASGGTERQFTNLAIGLDRSRFDVRFGCLRYCGQLIEELESRKIPMVEYPIRSFYHPGAFAQQMRFARDLRRDGVEIVHSYNFYGNVFGVPAARMAGVPVVIASIRDMGVYLDAAQRRVQRLACRLADRILVNAEAVRRWLISEGYEAGKIGVITNGIDLTRFTDAPTAGSDADAGLGLAPGAPLVLLVSRLVPRKGIEHFLEAAARLAPRFPLARFVIVGEQAPPQDGARDYRRQLEQHAARVGLGAQVLFTGPRRDIPSLMARAAVSVLPSLSEGLSNVLLESMAVGAPVVATRVGGAPEVVEDGVTGLLVPPGAPAELARAIAHVLEHPDAARGMGAAARRLIFERFSMDRMVAATEDQYVTLLDQARRGRRVPA